MPPIVLIGNVNQNSSLTKATTKQAFPHTLFIGLWISANGHLLTNHSGFCTVWECKDPGALGLLKITYWCPLLAVWAYSLRRKPRAICLHINFVQLLAEHPFCSTHVFSQHLLFVCSHTWHGLWKFWSHERLLHPTHGIMEKGIREPDLKIWLETNLKMINRKIKSQK